MKAFILAILLFCSVPAAVHAEGTVVCVHGFMRGSGNMALIHRALNRSKMRSVNWTYPSRHKCIEAHAEELVETLNAIADAHPGEPISFVTHSMGGLVTRAALNHPNCPDEAKIGCAVLIAPPNNGSLYARKLAKISPIRRVLGPHAGHQLMSCEDFDHLGAFPSTMPVLVISGTAGINPAIPSPNDGKVTCRETCLSTPHYHMKSFSGHSWICYCPTVIAATKKFIKEKSMAASTSTTNNVCDLNHIYQPGVFEYSLPKAVLTKFWNGTAFSEGEPYTDAEIEKVAAATRKVYGEILAAQPEQRKIALLSAGAPGAGKTTLLKAKVAEGHYGYVCPDDVCLPELTGGHSSDPAAYAKWRAGSNAITHTILPNLIKEGYAFAFGTTCASDKTGLFLAFLKERGYQIKIVHVSAPDQVRIDSIHLRDATFVQTTDEDIRQKGLDVPQRIHDTFLAFADEVEFHCRTEATGEAIHAATWVRDTNTLTILDPDAYEVVKDVHNLAIATVGKPELSWEATIEASARVIAPEI